MLQAQVYMFSRQRLISKGVLEVSDPTAKAISPQGISMDIN